MKKIIVILMCMLAIGIVAIVPDSNADQKAAADYLADIGIKHYQRGEVDRAIHELSKALLLDADNERAIATLQKMGVNHRMYTGGKTKIVEIAELSHHVKQYRLQIATLMQEKEAIENKLNEVLLERDTLTQKRVAKDLEMDLMQVKLDETAKIFDTEKKIQLRQLEQIEGMYMAKINEMRKDADYRTSMTFKELLSLREQELRAKEEHFAQLNRQFTRTVGELMRYEDRLNEIDGYYFDLKEQITTKRAIDTDMLTLLEMHLDEQRQIIEDLKDELIYNAFDMGQKNAMIDRQGVKVD